MPNVHVSLADAITGLTVNLQRYEVTLRREVMQFLRLLEDDLVKKIEQYDLEGVDSTSAKYRRAEALIGQIEKTIKTGYTAGGKHLRQQLIELSDYTRLRMPGVLNEVFGGNVFTTALTRGDMRTLVSDIIVRGHPLGDWWAEQSRGLRNRFAQQVRLGVGAGETNADIIRRIRGDWTHRSIPITIDGKTRMVREFAGGIMDISTNEASTLVRSSVKAISNRVMTDMYKENDDILRGMTPIVTLDLHTSDICIARSGAAWDFDGNPLPESTVQEHYPGDPPWHPNCRTDMGPLTKTWAQIIEENTGKRLKVLEEEMPVSTRAALGGPVPAKLNYEQWLETRSKADQIEALGQGKYNLWVKGELTPPELIDQHGNALTLQQLLER